MGTARILAVVFALVLLAATAALAAPATSVASTPQTNSAAQPAPAPAAALSAADIYKKDLPSIIYIEEEAKDGNAYNGSGFMAIKDGYAVTAWHMVHDAKSVTARFSDGETFDVTGLVDHDAKNDVALIKVKVSGRPLLNLTGGEPEIGDKAYVIGTPLEKQFDFTITDGIISQIRHDPYLFQFTCPATHGDSGGPLLDSTGHVIGIVQGGVDQGPNIAFAVPAQYALALDPTLPTKPWSDVVDDTPADQLDSDADTSVDKVLSAGYMMTIDGLCYAQYFYQWTHTVNYTFRNGVPPLLYTMQDNVKKVLDDLANASTDDPGHEALRADEITRLESISDALEYDSRGMLVAQSSDGWDYEANDLRHRAIGAYQEVEPFSEDDIQLLLSSKVFAAADPDALAALKDENSFRLGISTLFRDPLFVCLVDSGSVAGQIGLKLGDRLVAIDGQKPTSLLNARDLIQKDVGKTVDIVVQRGDKQVEIKKQVPAPASPPSP